MRIRISVAVAVALVASSLSGSRAAAQSGSPAAAELPEAAAQAVRGARQPLEPFGPRTLLSRAYTTVLPNAPPGEYVVIRYSMPAGGGRTAIETVVPAREAGRWRVSGYFVQPQ